MKNRKSIIALLLVAIIGIVGLTVAYFSSSTSIENTFETSEYGADAIEIFTSPTGWQPGDETPKVLTVKNTGEVDEAVRVKVEESWKSKNNTDLPLTQGNNVAAIVNYINPSDWTRVDVDGEDYYYYYYNYKLAPDEETSELLDKVTFNPLINASTTCTTTTENGVTTRSCTSNGSGYDGATYTLKFTIETVQYNKYADAWNTNVSIAPTKEIIVYGLHVNPKSETYETGDKHQMFAFKHDATDQTPQQIDYRYIGNDPYNYVYFNCDSLDNQNSETCEVWRIIGIFDVERPNPENEEQIITEQRIKLVRNVKFSDDMQWDDRSDGAFANDWSNASLKNFLNNDYYNRLGSASDYGLKRGARDLIEKSKYYLGGTGYAQSAEKMYELERGTAFYWNAVRPIYWIGNVALLYPSDQYMTYGAMVNDRCYNSPVGCSRDYAKSSWLYNMKTLANNDDGGNWFLTPNSTYSDYAFVSYASGELYNNCGVRYIDTIYPVLYLSSSVKIIGGTGEESNPYKLSL